MKKLTLAIVIVMTLISAACSPDKGKDGASGEVEPSVKPSPAPVASKSDPSPEKTQPFGSRDQGEAEKAERARIEFARRANELDRMERAAQAEKLLQDPSYIPQCESAMYVEQLKRAGLKMSERVNGMCVNLEGGEMTSLQECLPCN